MNNVLSLLNSIQPLTIFTLPNTATYKAVQAIRVGGIYEICSEGDKNLYWTAAGNCVLFTIKAQKTKITGTAGITYNIYRSNVSGAEVLVAYGLTTPSYVDGGLDPGTYYYKVSAVNEAGEGPLSDEVSVVVKPLSMIIRYYSEVGAKIGLDIGGVAQPSIDCPATGVRQLWKDLAITIPSLKVDPVIAETIYIFKVYAITPGIGIESIRFN